MKTEARAKLLLESQQALREAVRVLAKKTQATTEQLTAAHRELNRTTDALANEPGLQAHLCALKNYKVALKISLETRARQTK